MRPVSGMSVGPNMLAGGFSTRSRQTATSGAMAHPARDLAMLRGLFAARTRFRVSMSSGSVAAHNGNDNDDEDDDD